MLDFLPGIVAAAGLSAEEQASVQTWLSGIHYFLLLVVVSLILVAVGIRYYARQTTRPCHWCSEFIPKQSATCPRCGQEVYRPEPAPDPSAKH